MFVKRIYCEKTKYIYKLRKKIVAKKYIVKKITQI